MELQEALSQFEKLLYQEWERYDSLQKKLDDYRGKVISAENEKEINLLLNEIQESMARLWPSFEWVLHRAHKMQQVAVHYNAFIEDLKQAGAKPVDRAEA